MKVTKVGVQVRFSRQSSNGDWKAIELSAEAELDIGDSMIESQDALYSDIASQMKKLWSIK